MRDLPSGTVTFLFTDIEGSTKRWEQYQAAMKVNLARHDELLRSIIEAHGGYVFKTIGDAFCAAFTTPAEALDATLQIQRALSAEEWGEAGQLRVRAALHTGAAEERDGDYFGPPVNRVARLLSAGYGEQILLSLATQELVRDALSPDVSLLDLGEHRLKDLQRPERIYQVLAPNLPDNFPPVKTLDSRPNNLPLERSPIIGRTKELAAAQSLLLRDDTAIVTFIGPGGTGKTRLALQVAADLADRFKDGVFLVPLAPINDPELVVSTIAQTLGVREIPGNEIAESLKDYLRDKEMLLVLDNFEQVLSAAPKIAELLGESARLKIMATSREALHLRGEKEFPVPPMSLPDPKHLPPIEMLTQYESVALFVQRALDVKPGFQVTNENAPAVAEICYRLDGIPLAIELAAARVKLLPPQAMLARLTSRLKLLTGGASDMPARQQTLRNAIAWSYDLLNDQDKILFRRIAVFVGGSTLEAVEVVCNPDGALEADTLDEVASLTDKSLLRQVELENQEDEPRFAMLEMIREYALERLEESEDAEFVREQHAGYYLGLVHEADACLRGPEHLVWLKRLEVEHDNLRAALRWTIDMGKTDEALRLTGGLWWFWFTHGYLTEGKRWLQEALVQSGVDVKTPERVKALYACGNLALHLGDYEAAQELYEQSLVIAEELGDRSGIANSLNGQGFLAGPRGDYELKRSLHKQALHVFREIKDKPGVATSLRYLADAEAFIGDYEATKALYEESLGIFRQLRDKQGIARVLLSLGILADNHGDYTGARLLYQESLELSRELDDKLRIAYSLGNLGNVALEKGEYESAGPLFSESLKMLSELGDRYTCAAYLAGLAGVANAHGQPERAVRLLASVETLLDSIGAQMDPSNRARNDHSLAAARAHFDETTFSTLWKEGQAMTIEQIINYAIEQI